MIDGFDVSHCDREVIRIAPPALRPAGKAAQRAFSLYVDDWFPPIRMGHLWRTYILMRFSISNSNSSFLTLGTTPHARGPCAIRGTLCSFILFARSS